MKEQWGFLCDHGDDRATPRTFARELKRALDVWAATEDSIARDMHMSPVRTIREHWARLKDIVEG
jgi:hypothetical protein